MRRKPRNGDRVNITFLERVLVTRVDAAKFDLGEGCSLWFFHSILRGGPDYSANTSDMQIALLTPADNTSGMPRKRQSIDELINARVASAKGE
jgi:hypothetical protein